MFAKLLVRMEVVLRDIVKNEKMDHTNNINFSNRSDSLCYKLRGQNREQFLVFDADTRYNMRGLHLRHNKYRQQYISCRERNTNSVEQHSLFFQFHTGNRKLFSTDLRLFDKGVQGN